MVEKSESGSKFRDQLVPLTAGWVLRIAMAIGVFLSGLTFWAWFRSERLVAETFQTSTSDVVCELGVRNKNLYAKYKRDVFGNGGTSTLFLGQVPDRQEGKASIRTGADGLVEYCMDDEVVATLDLNTMWFRPHRN